MYELLFTEMEHPKLGKEKLGAGTSGTVWKSEDGDAAIKVGPDLQKEADIMASMRPNRYVCRFFSSKRRNPIMTEIAMELILGISLRYWFDRLDFDDSINWTKILCIFIQIFSGIAHLHEHRIFHGDIKPANIMIIERDDETIEIKIIDFGQSSYFGSIPQRETGSPLYFSPEIACKFGIDGSSDIWAAALIMLECVSGGRTIPWFLMDFKTKEDIVEKLESLNYARTPFPAEYFQHESPIAAFLAGIVQRCLALDKSERPSAQDVVTELSAKLAELGGA
jgi:serine/threonine protein kinase